MKLYQTSEARASAIETIAHLIEKINQVSGNELDYIASRQTTHYLSDLIKVIAEEDRKEKEKTKEAIDLLKHQLEEKRQFVERIGYDPDGGAGQAHSNRVAYRLLIQIEDLNAEIHDLEKGV